MVRTTACFSDLVIQKLDLGQPPFRHFRETVCGRCIRGEAAGVSIFRSRQDCRSYPFPASLTFPRRQSRLMEDSTAGAKETEHA